MEGLILGAALCFVAAGYPLVGVILTGIALLWIFEKVPEEENKKPYGSNQHHD